jgi:hypothetical protein
MPRVSGEGRLKRGIDMGKVKRNHILIGWNERTGDFEYDIGNGVRLSDLAMFSLHLQKMALGKAKSRRTSQDTERVAQFFEEHPFQPHSEVKISEYLDMNMDILKKSLKQLVREGMIEKGEVGWRVCLKGGL